MTKSIILFVVLTIILIVLLLELYNLMSLYTDQVIHWERVVENPTQTELQVANAVKSKLVFWILLISGFILFYVIFYGFKTYKYLSGKM